jgi:hypothetical protein
MATIKKNGSGWRAQIAIQGTRESKTFSTKAEATRWAAERETEIRKQATTGVDVRKTCGDAFNRYGREVSIHKKKTRWEQTRLAFIGNQVVGGTPLKDALLNSLTSDMLGQWRDKRLNVDKVAGSTVNRDFSLLSNVFTVARKEWKWMRISPSTDVRRPKDPPPRDRRILKDEIDMITLASGFCETKVRKVGQRVGVAFRLLVPAVNDQLLTLHRPTAAANRVLDTSCIHLEAKATKKPKASKTKAAPATPAQLELPQADMIDLASVATTDALRKFISEHPERLPRGRNEPGRSWRHRPACRTPSVM